MNFKQPRDPNTESFMVKERDALPGELCSVGRGECRNQAVEVHDDTEGGEFMFCSEHLVEANALAKLIAEMTPNQIGEFGSAITRVENKS